MVDGDTGRNARRSAGGEWPIRLLAYLLIAWEPLAFAVVAAGAFNAVQIRGHAVTAVLLARLVTTAACIAAGRSLLARQSWAPSLAKGALAGSAAVQVFAAVTPYFPSNRVPGDTPLFVAETLAYYGGWILYLLFSRRVADVFK
ncbi:MAG: hypothetical protein AB7Q29_14255 [Vicinamibacterales bacterium]